MRVVHLVWLLSGCNLVFPLSLTEPSPPDGSPTDTPTGSVVCPESGVAPRYASELFTRMPNCSEYTEDLDRRGMAYCGEGFTDSTFAESPPDDPSITPIPLFTSTSQLQYQRPRLAPEGDQLFMLVLDSPAPGFTLQTSVKSGTEWGAPSSLTAPNEPDLLLAVLEVGTPTAGPNRRLMINVADGIHEVQVDGMEVTTVYAYGADGLGFTFVQAPNLTSDGLRAVVLGLPDSGGRQVFYLERGSLDVPFAIAVPLEGVPLNPDVFMTSNCARLYAASAGKVLFARQL